MPSRVTEQQKRKVRKRLIFDDETPRAPAPEPQIARQNEAGNTPNSISCSPPASSPFRPPDIEPTEFYNFNFKNGVPLEGDWEWTPVAQQPSENTLKEVENEQGRSV